MMYRHVSRLLALLIVAAACGSDDHPGPNPSPRTPTTDVSSAERDTQLSPRVNDKLPTSRETYGQGQWAVRRPPRSATQVDPEELERLLSLGYADGERPAPQVSDVTVYDKARAWPGLNLYIDGHAPEANLIDMEGRLIHRWAYEVSPLAQELGIPHAKAQLEYWFRRVYPFPNGDLLAVVDNLMLIKIDKRSNLLWVYTGRTHHDLDVAPSGDIYVLTAARRHLPSLDEKRMFNDNYIVRLDADGNERDRVSIFEALERGRQTELLRRIRALLPKPRGRSGDILHINSIEILDGRLSDRIPAFKRGNVLICSPQIHAIMVVDLTQRAVVWSMVGSFRFQHHPTVLENGNLLLFDNRRGPNAQSASLELDAFSGEEVWAYRGSPDEPFFSRCCGTTYRLPNGNTLIVETEGGRAFEVTPEHDLVWEFVNPHRAGEKEDLIAQLFDLIRLGSEFSLDWLPPASGL